MERLADHVRIRRNPRIVSRSMQDGGGVLLHLDTGAYHGLNPIGAMIWELIGTDRTFGALLDDLRSRLEGSPDTLADDIGAFVRGLYERGLVEIEQRRDEQHPAD